MARKPREDVPGVHHVWARGNKRRAIFADSDDRTDYLRLLRKTVARMRWRCLAYCLMDNHVHLLLETQTANLGSGMQYLHGLYGLGYNERHGEDGHIFQGRFGSKLVTSDEHLWHLVGYIVGNPVDAGLCDRPEDWPWSSHATLDRGDPAPWLDHSRLLHHLEGTGGNARARYAELTRMAALPLKRFLWGQTP